ncbi:MAG: tetratricopeptide repeat protein [Bacteroidetes bacterium]|nr:tetratricopeptide repeat protein [Bacteroidota bacterium]
MQSARIKQLALFLLAIGLVAFLFINGRNNSSALVNEKPSSIKKDDDLKQGFDFAMFEKDVKRKLGKNEIEEINNLEKNLTDNKNLLALAEKYDKLEKPVLAGYYYFQLAGKAKSNADYWQKAGKKFFESASQFSDSLTFIYLAGLSTKSYEKSLEIAPNNLDAKADLAVNYIEASPDPMKGVGLLRSIIQTDSMNKKAIMYLGFFSMKSKQYPKAIKRFEKLVDIDPNYPYYLRYLAEAYIAGGRKEDAIKTLQTYKTKVHDKRLLDEADKVINNIK